MVPVAHGNDGMGSIRIPAACCGLVGIKPGLGRVPAELGATDWYGMSENGALTTTVGDAALMLSVLADDASLATVNEFEGLRIAVSTKSPVQGVSVDREWLTATFMSAAALMRHGHAVERREIKYPTTAALGALARWFAGAATDADTHDADLLERRVATHAAIGRRVRTTPLMTESWRESWRAAAGEFLTEYDVLLTPALARSPIEAQAWSTTSWATTMAANVSYAPFAAPWNFAGFPAMTVPAGVHSSSATPLAVQLVAAPGRESLLLGVAAQLERLRPWSLVAPAYA
jgi:amidase